jgi:LacI family transcriptional regulator
VTPQYNQPFYVPFYEIFQSYASRDGYLLNIVQAGDVRDEPALVRELDKAKVEGIILLSPSSPANRFEPLLTTHRPMVAVNSSMESRPGLATIAVNNETGLREAIKSQLEKGHRAFVYFGGPSTSGSNRARRAIIESALGEQRIADLRVIEMRGPLPADQQEYGYVRARELLKELGNSTKPALLTYNDLIALGAIRAVYDEGLSVPKHMSIVGFDNLEASRLSVPRLSTVAVPRDEMAVEAVRTLIRMIEMDFGAPSYRSEFSTRYLERESTAAPA